MRAIRRLSLVPLAVAATVLSVAAASAQHVPPAGQHTAAFGLMCPEGTNWDTGLQACV